MIRSQDRRASPLKGYACEKTVKQFAIQGGPKREKSGESLSRNQERKEVEFVAKCIGNCPKECLVVMNGT